MPHNEICPWCHKEIQVSYGTTPCPKCKKPIRVFPDDELILKRMLGLATKGILGNLLGR